MLLYILHFDSPRHHAKHYVGSTLDATQRLTAHANGRGARLTQVLHEDGQGWSVAALFQPINSLLDIRHLESDVKRQKNGLRYCPICNPDAPSPKGTISIPFPKTHSSDLKDSNHG